MKLGADYVLVSLVSKQKNPVYFNLKTKKPKSKMPSKDKPHNSSNFDIGWAKPRTGN